MSTPLGYQQILAVVVDAGNAPLTLPTAPLQASSSPQKPTYALVTPEGQACRWRDDGVAPTAAIGYPLAVGQELRCDSNLTAIRFISQTAGCILNVSYYYGNRQPV